MTTLSEEDRALIEAPGVSFDVRRILIYAVERDNLNLAEADAIVGAIQAAREQGRQETRGAVAEAFRKGAMAAIGCELWDDADDFFTLVGMGYAAGEPFPPTMPKPRQEGRASRENSQARFLAFQRLFDAWEAWDIPDDTPPAMIDAMETAAQLFFADPGHKQEAAASAMLSASTPPAQNSDGGRDG